jgi:ATP-dependent Clp protease ATP-binding subunit ClpX
MSANAKGGSGAVVAVAAAVDSAATAVATLTPAEIYAKLGEDVIGQPLAKKILSVALYNHLKRVNYRGSVRLEKSNILMIGPTGSGKTLLVRTMAKIMGVPFVVGNATSLTESGYVGEDVESLLTRLLQKSNQDVELAQKGVVFVDEVDKLVPKNPLEGVSTTGVQADLLKLLEGTEVEVPKSGVLKSARTDFVTMDTSRILFITAGAFKSLEEIVARRVRPGFHPHLAREKVDPTQYMRQITPDDLIQFGLLSELVGRLPIVVPLTPLSRDDLVRILTEPSSSLVKQYQELMAMDGVNLSYSDESLGAIAEAAIAEGSGARGLRRIMEEVMLDLMFKLPSRSYLKNCIVTEERVRMALSQRTRRRAARQGQICMLIQNDEDEGLVDG